MQRRIAFSKTTIERLIPPQPGKRETWFDAQVPGLVLIATDKGSKTFFVRRKVRGRSERIHIGRYPDVTVERARNRAREIVGQLASGKEPSAIRNPKGADHTLGEAFQLYVDGYAKLHKRSWKEDVAQFRRYLLPLSTRRLSSLAKVDLLKLHADVAKSNGQYAANRLLALLSKLFSFAKDVGIYLRENPARGIRKFPERPRVRYLGPDELPAFFRALDHEGNDTLRDFFWTALLTGQRRSNVCAMRWTEVDFTQAEWHIPFTKNGTPHTVPLTPKCLEILLARQSLAQGEYVFPGRGRTGHLVEPKAAWDRLLVRAGLKDLRIHDLRHTLASWQAGMGASLPIIAASLNHKGTAVTQRYAHIHNGVVRNAMAQAADAMLAAGSKGQSEKEKDVGQDFTAQTSRPDADRPSAAKPAGGERGRDDHDGGAGARVGRAVHGMAQGNVVRAAGPE